MNAAARSARSKAIRSTPGSHPVSLLPPFGFYPQTRGHHFAVLTHHWLIMMPSTTRYHSWRHAGAQGSPDLPTAVLPSPFSVFRPRCGPPPAFCPPPLRSFSSSVNSVSLWFNCRASCSSCLRGDFFSFLERIMLQKNPASTREAILRSGKRNSLVERIGGPYAAEVVMVALASRTPQNVRPVSEPVPRRRPQVLVCIPGVSVRATLDTIQAGIDKLAQALSLNTEAVARNDHDLCQENTRQQTTPPGKG